MEGDLNRLKDFLFRKKEVKRPPESKDLQLELYTIRKVIDQWANSSSSKHKNERGKPYLPDKAIIPTKNGQSLIAIESLRADKLFIPRDRDDVPTVDRRQKFFDRKDVIEIPTNFAGDDCYIVLLIPQFSWVGEPMKDSSVPNGINMADVECGLARYQITVLKKQADCLAKLGTYEEALSNSLEVVYSESGERIVKKVAPERWMFKWKIPYDPEENQQDLDWYLDTLVSDLEYISLDQDKRTIPIWRGATARHSPGDPNKFREEEYKPENIEARYKQTVNRTICYKFILGTPEKEKKPIREPLKQLVTIPLQNK